MNQQGKFFFLGEGGKKEVRIAHFVTREKNEIFKV